MATYVCLSAATAASCANSTTLVNGRPFKLEPVDNTASLNLSTETFSGVPQPTASFTNAGAFPPTYPHAPSKAPSLADWDRVKPIITEMYLDPATTLKEVMHKLAHEHGFFAR
jgi:hypothetical protein